MKPRSLFDLKDKDRKDTANEIFSIHKSDVIRTLCKSLMVKEINNIKSENNNDNNKNDLRDISKRILLV